MNPYFLSGSICRQVRATGWWKLVKMGVWEWGFCGCRKIEGRTIECFHIYIYMDNPWKSSCSKKTKIYTIIQVSVYDLIWRSQSRFPQKYFCLKLLEHFKFIVHLSFITSLDMSGHFVCIQKNKVDRGGDWRIMKSGRNWSYFPSLKNCLKRGLCWKHFPKKKLPENPRRACQEAGAPKGNSRIFHPKGFSYVCFRDWVFLFLNVWFEIHPAKDVFRWCRWSRREKTWRKPTPKKCEPQKFLEFCVE